MQILFKEEVGIIASILHSLYYAENMEELQETLQIINITLDEQIKNDLSRIKDDPSLQERVSFFFNNQTHLWKALVHTREMWKYTSLKDYLDSLKNLTTLNIKQRLYLKLNKEKSEIDKEHMERVINNNNEFVSFLKGLPLDSNQKWNIFCFIDETEKYVKQFSELIEGFLPTYQDIFSKHKQEANEFNEKLKSEIQKDPYVYVKKLTNKYLNIDYFNNIFITSSFYNTYNLNFAFEGENLYLYVGPRYHMLLEKDQLANKVDNELLVLKNLSDKSRFNIAKYLLTGEHYGQEIAEYLKVSTAAVSYQMNYLFEAGLVYIEKRDRKIYYSLNKERLRTTLSFLMKELDL